MNDDSPRRRCILTISGEFTDTDLAAFVALVRHIDGNNPEGHYGVMIDDPRAKIAEAEPAMHNTILPEVPGRTTTIVSIPFKQ